MHPGGTAASKSSQHAGGVPWLSSPLSRGRKARYRSSGAARNYWGGPVVGLVPVGTHVGSTGAGEGKTKGEGVGPPHLPAHALSSSQKQAGNRTTNLQSLLGLLPTRLSLGGHLMVCDSGALKYSFLIQLLNLVLHGRNRALIQHQKINWRKRVVGDVKAPRAISEGMSHQPEKMRPLSVTCSDGFLDEETPTS